MRVKFPQIDPNVDNFPNPMGPGPCTKKESDSTENGARKKPADGCALRADTLRYWMLQLQMRFENFREVSSLVDIDKNKYMTSFQLVKNINEMKYSMREKSINFRIYTKKTLCILSLIAYSSLIKI